MRTKNIAMFLTLTLTAGLCQTAAPSQAATPKLSAKNLTIKVGKTLQLTTNYAPASTGTPSYSSSNKKVATVDSKGVVKGVKAGTATITVKVNGVTAKAEITVK